MMGEWKSIGRDFPGVRFREHPTRKHGILPDRYFAIRYQIDGERHEEGLGWASQGWTPTEAFLQLAKLKKAAREGKGATRLSEKRKQAREERERARLDEERRKKEAVTFGQFFDEKYYPHAKQEKTSWSFRREKSLFRLWIYPVIGEIPFKDISPVQVERIKRNMIEAGKAPRSVHYALAVIRQVFNFAKRSGLFIGVNPVKQVRKPKYDNKRLRFLTHDEAAQLLAILNNKNPLLHDMAILSLHCGLRAGEVFKLTWDDVNFEHNLLTLRDTKGGQSRSVYMTNQVRAMLLARRQNKKKTTDLVFPNRKGQKIKEISKSFRRYVSLAGLNGEITDRRQKVTFHTLRHTYASWLVIAGVDLYVVQKLLGHSTIAMTERYAHLSPDKFKQAADVFEKSMVHDKYLIQITTKEQLRNG